MRYCRSLSTDQPWHSSPDAAGHPRSSKRSLQSSTGAEISSGQIQGKPHFQQETLASANICQNNYNRGYERLYGQTVQSDGIPDLKEGFYISRDLPLDHPQVKRGKFAHGPNVWPEALDSTFKTTCMDYLSHLITLSEQLMEALALSLNLDRGYFKEFCEEPMCFYKMLHYPPQQPDADPRQQGRIYVLQSPVNRF